MSNKLFGVILAVAALIIVPMFVVSCRTVNPPSSTTVPMNRFGMTVLEDAVIVHTIVDGLEEPTYLLGEPTSLVKFELRNDGWQHTSVRLNGGEGLHKNYSSAVVLVPTADDLKEWQAWFTKAVADAKKKTKQVPNREYPTRVLPPK